MELVAESPSDITLLATSLAAQVATKPIGQIGAADQGQVVSVDGTILDSRRLSTGVRFVLGDDTGEVILLVWDDVLSKTPERDELGVGARVTAQGKVEVYKDELEIVPSSGTDVIVTRPASMAESALPTSVAPTAAPRATAIPQPTATTRPASTPTPVAPPPTPEPTAAPLPAALAIGAVTRDAIGQVLTVKGQVVDASSTSAGFKFLLDDGTGRIDLFMSGGVYGHVAARSGLNVGALVLVTGELQDYKGALEIVPRLAQNVVILAAGARAAGPPRLIASIGEGDKDQFVTLQCTIVAREALSGGIKLRARDDSGDIDVIVWDNVMAYVSGSSRLVEGTRLSVTGKVDFFRGAAQVVPQIGYDVKILD
jgi:DNA/RNA endonuclease YhcR with UshA esterase domain